MALKPRTLAEMTAESLDYLARNSDITALGRGSAARALVDANNLEIAKLQDFIITNYQNAFLSTAQGIYLDLFGEQYGLSRRNKTPAVVLVTDRAIRFYVTSGTLGSRLPDPSDSSKGRISKGTEISTPDGAISFIVIEDVTFPVNAKSAYASAQARTSGVSSNVGVNQLTTHSIGDSNILVTNDMEIKTGTEVESDDEYRFRLSKALTARLGNNETSVQIAALAQPGVVRADLLKFARGAGTFDVLLVPEGNRVSKLTADSVRRAVEDAVAFGISPRIREPEYIPFRLTVRLTFASNIGEGQQAATRSLVQSAILRFFGSIRLGGELVVNQLLAAILDSSPSIKDATILELCIDSRPRSIRNFKLEKDELFTPDDSSEDPVAVL